MKIIKNINDLTPRTPAEKAELDNVISRKINIGSTLEHKGAYYILDNTFFTKERGGSRRIVMGVLVGVNGATLNINLNDSSVKYADVLMQTCSDSYDILAMIGAKCLKCGDKTVYDKVYSVATLYHSTANIFYYIKEHYVEWTSDKSELDFIEAWITDHENRYPDVLRSRLDAKKMSDMIAEGKRYADIGRMYNTSREFVRVLAKSYAEKYPDLILSPIKKKKSITKEVFNNVLVRIAVSEKMKKAIDDYFADNEIIGHTQYVGFWQPVLESFLSNPTEIKGEYLVKSDSGMLSEERKRPIKVHFYITQEMKERLDDYVKVYNETHSQHIRGKGRVVLQALDDFLM